MQYIWLIPLLPGIGAAINGLLGVRFFSKRAAGALACTMMAARVALSIVAFVQLLGLPADARAYDVAPLQWIPRFRC
jgi:NADH:ubiquinone oxidoreductase subunit 5 (subunit L)/multisubunit Na+/H+ antiporter MnhA subunit